MSLLFGQHKRDIGDPGQPLYPARPSGYGTGDNINGDNAKRHSAVWACLRLRADTVSVLSIDQYRKVMGKEVSVDGLPPSFATLGGPQIPWDEWLYSTQMDLDAYGNCFGLITGRQMNGQVAQMELVGAADVTVRKASKTGKITYRFHGNSYDPIDVWHERQYTVPGVPVGLSPITFASMVIGQYISAQRFVTDWFTGGQVPKGSLKNIARTITPTEAQEAKDRFSTILERGGVLVTGNDWEFKPIAAQSNDMIYLEAMSAADTDIARFFGVPAEMIGAGTRAGTTIMYSNITQKNLDFLTINMAPVLGRRERAISRGMLPNGRYIKFKTDAMLRMDPQTRALVYAQQIASAQLSVDEARALEGRAPMKEAAYKQFGRLFGKVAAASLVGKPQGGNTPADPPDDPSAPSMAPAGGGTEGTP